MIDSHCHLDHEPLFTNIPEVLKRSKNIGIKKILTICTTLNSFESIKKILELDDIIYGTFGIHPHETDKNYVSKKIILNNIKKNRKIIGIGETGLDFFYEIRRILVKPAPTSESISHQWIIISYSDKTIQ